MKELTILYFCLIVTLMVELVFCQKYAQLHIKLQDVTDYDRATCDNHPIQKNLVTTIDFPRSAANGIENPCQCYVTVYETSTYIQIQQYYSSNWNYLEQVLVSNPEDKFTISLNGTNAEIQGSTVVKIDLRQPTKLSFEGSQEKYRNELRCNMVMKKNDSMVDPVVKTSTLQEPTTTTTTKGRDPKTRTPFPETKRTRKQQEPKRTTTPQAPNNGTLSTEDTTNQTQMKKMHMLPTILIVVIILAVLVLVIIAVVLISLQKVRGYICTKNKKEQSTNNQYDIISQNESSFSKDIPLNNNLNQNGGILKINVDEEIDNKDTTYVNAPTNSNDAQVTNGVEQTEYAEIKIGELAPKEKPEPSNENAGLTYAELSFHDQQNQGDNVSDLYAKPNKQK